MDYIDEEYDRLVEHLQDCTKKAESFKATKRRLSLETLELIRQQQHEPQGTKFFYSDLFDSHVHLSPHHLREDGQVIPEVLPSEIRHAIMSVRNRTAPGPDRIRPEHLKNLPPVLVNTLARLFTRYLSECKVPKQWKTSKTVLLYKKGDPHDIGNYRPICLMSVIYKLFTRVILNRIEKVLYEGPMRASRVSKRIQHD
ncbi:hypothetical protein RB195_001213 [Necator americanus]|uniref:Reverse transcriptase domain-containing protein n=1 Tax=Necator americanus TaxID=51031 RepID=A0ABR1DDD7_NECAM